MKKLVVLSGKGGTGKTTLSSYLISSMNINKFADCDVDAPNLDQITNLDDFSVNKTPYQGSSLFKIDEDKCISCGKCFSSCRFLAIDKKDKKFRINEYMCEGCALCYHVCPVNAISEYYINTGEVIKYSKTNTSFVTAKLNVGSGASGKLVSEVRQTLNSVKLNSEITLVDGSPGVGCAVIASLTGNDYSIIVTEASLSGFSDLKRIVSLSIKMNIRPLVVINKADLNFTLTSQIKGFLEKENITYLGSIRYDWNILKRNNNQEYDKNSIGLLDLEQIKNNIKKIIEDGN